MARTRPSRPVPRPVLQLAAAAALAVLLAAPLRSAAAVGAVTPDQVEKMLSAPDVRVFDANTDDVFRANHVPGAVHIGDRDLAQLLPANKDTRLVFYCTSPG